MEATKDDNGKEKRDSETLQKTFMGLGAASIVQFGGGTGTALLVGSTGYLFGEIGCTYRLFQNAMLTAGYQWRTLRYRDDITARINGAHVGIELSF
jgi:hypothetical protein